MNKSYFNPDPKIKYCVDHSYKLQPVQRALIEDSLKNPRARMLGAVEVLQTCTCLIKQIKAKSILDIGTFTGLSALSWALAIPDDGRVVTMDVQDEDYKNYGKKHLEASGIVQKIEFRVQPALKTLDDLIAAGESGKFDFAFLDAVKTEYPQYYEKSLQLLRPGGFIAIDNSFLGDRIFQENKDEAGKVVDQLNDTIANDPRVHNVLLPIGDGLHLAFKKIFSYTYHSNPVLNNS